MRVLNLIRLGLATAVFAFSATSVWAQSDTQPPQLIGLTVTPESVDVTAAQQTVTVTVQALDDLSGLSGVQGQQSPIVVVLRGPSGAQAVQGLPLGILQGVVLNRTADVPVTLPRFIEPGQWGITVTLRDNAGNINTISAAVLAVSGFTSTVTVVNATPDLQGPEVTALSLSPSTLDVSAADGTFTADVTVTDNLSGFDTSSFAFDFVLTSPSGGQARFQVFGVGPQGLQRVSGTNLNGVWRGPIRMPRYSEPGLWRVTSITLRDAARNSRSYNATQLAAFGAGAQVSVSSTPADTTLPQINQLAIAPAFIDSSVGPQTVEVTLAMTDALSGVSFDPTLPNISTSYGLTFRSPSGAQTRNSTFSFAGRPPTTGTVHNGTWVLSVPFQQFSEAGTWTISRITVKDRVRNLVNLLTPQQVAALGFPTTLEVIRPSLVPDGVIGPIGGTLTDQTFGGRAQVTFPSGSLLEQTTIAIDVLTTAPLIPTPTGFLGGSFFTNLSLNPVPPMPFPVPGLTLVLPLSSARPLGTPVTLFRLDPLTGALVPAVSVSGSNVVGTVNPDGLSVTFEGVAHLSTVVAFVQNGVLGDVSGDETVNCADVALVRASFGKRTGQSGFDANADVTRDGIVNVVDLTIVSRQLPVGVTCR